MDRLLQSYFQLSRGARIGAAVSWYAVIFLLSHSTGTDADSTAQALGWLSLQDFNTLIRLAAHLVVFGIQGALVFGAMGPFGARGIVPLAIAALLITAGLAVGDEAHQGVVPGRHFRWIDVATDAVGAAVAVGLLAWLTDRNTATHTRPER